MKKIKRMGIFTVMILICLSFGILTACKEKHTHKYNQEVATEAFIVTEATCTQKATYYKSCECGEKGNYWHYDTDGKTPIVWIK